MSGQSELEERINEAYLAGDARVLEQLQAEYRGGGYATRILGAESITLSENASTTTTASRSAPVGANRSQPASAVIISRDTSWLIRNQIRIGETRNEAAGFVYGTFNDGILRVESITEAAEDAGADWVALSWERQLEAQEQFDSVGWSTLGEWHSHPYPADPSLLDLTGWRNISDRLNQYWLSLILAPRGYPGENGWEPDWSQPRIRAWVSRPGQTPAATPVIEMDEEN